MNKLYGLCLLWLYFPLTSQASLSQEIRFEQHLGNRIPENTILVDEFGRSQPIRAWLGHTPLILVFTYFGCPNLCTLVLNGLVDTLKTLPEQLGKDFQILTISIDPKERPPLALAKKRAYLAKFGSSDLHSAWHFLTSPPDMDRNVLQIASVSGFHYKRDLESGEYAHPSGIMVLSPEGVISQYFFGIQFKPESLHSALFRAKEGKTGSWIEEILLYCFHYDPKLTRNGPRILKAIRITGAAGAFLIMLFFISLFYSDKKSRSEP